MATSEARLLTGGEEVEDAPTDAAASGQCSSAGAQGTGAKTRRHWSDLLT